MRILADENFPGDAVAALRGRGHDVVWVRTDAPGSADTSVLQLAQEQQRIVITFDKDFGELAFRSRLPAACGIVLFRISASSPAHVANVAIAVLESRSDWAGHLAVTEDRRIRIVPLPTE
ncbi:MAG: DUF5615 family PIN-like protein [Chloroflexi bacterium]|nr:DUF5615 family PIN-like protein [Chloroflexota bacterium]